MAFFWEKNTFNLYLNEVSIKHEKQFNVSFQTVNATVFGGRMSVVKPHLVLIDPYV